MTLLNRKGHKKTRIGRICAITLRSARTETNFEARTGTVPGKQQSKETIQATNFDLKDLKYQLYNGVKTLSGTKAVIT